MRASGGQPLAAVYPNRLSDLLFILARAANAGGTEPSDARRRAVARAGRIQPWRRLRSAADDDRSVARVRPPPSARVSSSRRCQHRGDPLVTPDTSAADHERDLGYREHSVHAASTCRCTAGGRGRCGSSPAWHGKRTKSVFRYLLEHGQTGRHCVRHATLMGTTLHLRGSARRSRARGVTIDSLEDIRRCSAASRSAMSRRR